MISLYKKWNIALVILLVTVLIFSIYIIVLSGFGFLAPLFTWMLAGLLIPGTLILMWGVDRLLFVLVVSPILLLLVTICYYVIFRKNRLALPYRNTFLTLTFLSVLMLSIAPWIPKKKIFFLPTSSVAYRDITTSFSPPYSETMPLRVGFRDHFLHVSANPPYLKHVIELSPRLTEPKERITVHRFSFISPKTGEEILLINTPQHYNLFLSEKDGVYTDWLALDGFFPQIRKATLSRWISWEEARALVLPTLEVRMEYSFDDEEKEELRLFLMGEKAWRSSRKSGPYFYSLVPW